MRGKALYTLRGSRAVYQRIRDNRLGCGEVGMRNRLSLA